MKFTDDDLKRLKNELVKITENLEPGNRYLDIEKNQVWGLIDRLEAAEKLCNYLDGFDDVNNPIVNAILKAWRRSKGEGEGK